MTKTLEERKQAIWAKWERKLGMPLTNEFREEFECDIGWNDSEVELKDLDGLIGDFVKKLITLEYFPNPKSPKNSPKKRYQRSLKKRLHIVDFIIGQQLTINMVSRRSLSAHKRINWKQTCEAWNEAHPYDLMTPEVLKATFYRAISDESLQQEYFTQKNREFSAKFAETFHNFFADNVQALKRFGEIFERIGNQSIMLFEGISKFSSKFNEVAGSLLLFTDKLNSMTDSEKDEFSKQSEAEFGK